MEVKQLFSVVIEYFTKKCNGLRNCGGEKIMYLKDSDYCTAV
jgi:hypothetical protein